MNPEPQPASPGIGLPPEQFAAAFPFHLALDRDLKLVQAGATLRRICPDVQPGASLRDIFRPLHPGGHITPEWVLENRARFFLLEHLASHLQLRGEFLPLPGQDTILFLGSPWFTDASQIADHGLIFEDFAIHDPAVDMLQVYQASKMALADAKKLATRLMAQRAELQATNARLLEQQSQTRTLALVAARTDNAVVLTDATGLTLWLNEGFTRLTGYTLDEMKGRRPGSALQGPGTDPETTQRIRDGIRSGKGFREEILNYDKAGSSYWVAIEVQPIHDESGRLTNYMAIESDITDQRRVATELGKAKAAAEASNKAKGDFLALMSHEIRTPMNAVLGMTNLLLETPLNETQRDFLSTIARSGDALIQIINDILDFSKIESGEFFELEEEVFNVHLLVDEVVQLLRPMADTRGIAVTREVHPTLPKALRSDDGRLRQVLVNLVGNSLKFTETGSVTVRVHGLPAPPDRILLRFEVEDTGIGMMPADVDRLFQPFTQVDGSPSRRRNGTGLGLAISKRIIDLMGGRIGVASTLGKGSLFWFELTVALATVTDNQSEPRSAGLQSDAEMFVTATTPPPEGRPLRILVAEDHDTNRRLAMLMLEGLGHRADFVNNGSEAVQIWEQVGYDVILMDCRMPEMDGFEATRRIREREAARAAPTSGRVRIIALTANALKGDRELCLAAGMDGFISKPYTKQHLAAALGACPAKSSGPTAQPTVQPLDPASLVAPGFDPQRPAGLWAELGEDAMRGILADFLADLPTQTAEMKNLASGGRFEELALLAHSLQGIGLSAGLNAFSAMLRPLEDAATARDTDSVARILQPLAAEMERGAAALRTWMAGRAS